jgi:hypothetical protein
MLSYLSLCRHRVNILYIVILRTISAFSFWYMGIVTNTYGSLKCPPVEAEVPPIEFCHKPSVHKTEISTLELPCEISLRDLSPLNTQIKQELKSSNVCTRLSASVTVSWGSKLSRQFLGPINAAEELREVALCIFYEACEIKKILKNGMNL